MSSNHHSFCCCIPECQQAVLNAVVERAELSKVRTAVQFLEQFIAHETAFNLAEIIIYLLACGYREGLYELRCIVHKSYFKQIILLHFSFDCGAKIHKVYQMRNKL